MADEECLLASTTFRVAEKKYKLYKVDKHIRRQEINHGNDFSDVVDFKHSDSNSVLNQSKMIVGGDDCLVCAFADVPGLLILPGFLSEEEQQRWIKRALDDFSKSPPFRNNLTTLDHNSTTAEFVHGMRWATLGQAYNWTTKQYEKEASQFPDDLTHVVCKAIETCCRAGVLDASVASDYRCETAIVNYYPVGSMLMAHQDVSEECMEKPLVSMSLGCTAIFLMGTTSRNDPPTAFFLRSGDLALFTGPSRMAYHAVPRILDDCPQFLSDEEPRVEHMRINVNVRQVFSHP